MESFLIFLSFVIILGFSVAFVVGVWLAFVLYLSKTHKNKIQYENLSQMRYGVTGSTLDFDSSSGGSNPPTSAIEHSFNWQNA